MADVIPLRTTYHAPICSLCANGYIGAYGVYCVAFQEHINDEAAAASDCPEWEEA